VEPYRYEREVEEFLRWSPNVRSSRLRDAGGLSREQLAELQRLLSAYHPESGGELSEEREPASPPDPATDGAGEPREMEDEPASAEEPAAAPVDHYDDLGSEEIISLLASLDGRDLVALRDHEREHRGREEVIGAIDSVLARQASARG
jgi:hypothetical protein